MRRRLLSPADVALLAALLAAGAGGLILVSRRPPAGRCIVHGAGAHHVVELPADTTLAVEGPLGTTTVEVRGRSVRVADSPCPRKTCLRAGAVTRRGAVIACVPNRVWVRLEGGETDAVTR